MWPQPTRSPNAFVFGAVGVIVLAEKLDENRKARSKDPAWLAKQLATQQRSRLRQKCNREGLPIPEEAINQHEKKALEKKADAADPHEIGTWERDFWRLNSEDEAVVKTAKLSVRHRMEMILSLGKRDREWVKAETGDPILVRREEAEDFGCAND